MRERQELMERLSAADPLRDGERLTPDDQREADELLARLLATPVTEEERPAVGRPRRWALAAAATACVAVVAFAAVNLLDSADGPGPNIIERAVAAVSADDAIYHVVERVTASGDIPGGIDTIRRESWHTTDGRVHQKLSGSRRDGRGRYVGEYAGRRTPGRRGGPVLTWDAESNTIQSRRFGTARGTRGAPGIDQFSGPAESLRAFEMQGRLRVAGETEVGGRRAYRLTSGFVAGRAPESEERADFVVDAETYLPLSSRFTQRFPNGDSFTFHIRFLVYELLPLNKRNLAQLALDPHPGAKCGRDADKVMGRGSFGFPNPCAR